MSRLIAIYLCVLMLFTHAEAGWLKYRNKGFAATPAVGRKAVKRPRSRRTAKHHSRRTASRSKSRSFHPTANRPPASDWDAVMRRNSPSKNEGESQGEMLPEEFRQWMKNLSNEQLDLYLKFRITDAIPFAEVEAEAKRRGIR